MQPWTQDAVDRRRRNIQKSVGTEHLASRTEATGQQYTPDRFLQTKHLRILVGGKIGF